MIGEVHTGGGSSDWFFQRSSGAIDPAWAPAKLSLKRLTPPLKVRQDKRPELPVKYPTILLELSLTYCHHMAD